MNFFSCRTAAMTAHVRAWRRMASWTCVWLLAAPLAQAAETLSMPMPANAAAPFEQYKRWRDEPVQDWREANDRVGEIGGWMTYLREAQQGEGGMESGMHDAHHGH